tara:strand:+ start:176 stop:973 length:798 start_codon:yes stop_codon:yes gene_type:complete
MNYKEHFIACKDSFEGTKVSLESFYEKPFVQVPVDTFSPKYFENINYISDEVKNFFDSYESDEIMLNYPSFLDFEDELNIIAGELCDWLSDNVYGCHIYVDKVYIYRTKKMKRRKSSYKWHYDNNPQEIRKNIIYLTDVGEFNSPFEYLSKPNGEGLLMESTRTGPENWEDAPNGSRIDKEVKKLIKKEGHYSKKFVSEKGSIGSFINDIAHRGNPIIEGYRDVVNVRVKPTLEKPQKYIDKRWTGDTSSSGVVNPDPLISWNTN